CDLLEARKHRVELVAVEAVAELLERVLERVAPGVLAEHQLALREPDGGGVHDLVGERGLEHPVLVDAGLVGEGVPPDGRLVRLDQVAGEAADQAARPRDLRRLDAAPHAADVFAPGPQDHRELLEARVARALAYAVYAALDLPGAHVKAGQGV